MAVDVSASSSSASPSSKLDPLYPPPGPPPNYPPPPPPTRPSLDPPSQSLRASPVYSATSAPIDIPGPIPPSPGPPPPYPPPPPPTRSVEPNGEGSSTAMGVAETRYCGYGADLDVVDGDYVGKESGHRSKSPAHQLMEPHQRSCSPVVHPSKASSDPEQRNEHQAIRVTAPIATRTPIYTRNRPAPLNLDYHTRPQVYRYA